MHGGLAPSLRFWRRVRTGRSQVSWEPILTGGERELAWSAIMGIARDLESELFSERALRTRVIPAWLANGSAGVGLFFAYLWRATADLRHRRLAVHCLEDALQRIYESANVASLMFGALGVVWSYRHVLTMLGGRLVSELDEFDESLLELLRLPVKAPRSSGLITGLAGVLVYSAESGRGTMGELCGREAVALLAAAQSPVRGAWVREGSPAGSAVERKAHIDCTMVSGVAGVIGALALANGACDLGEPAAALLAQSVDWLVGTRLTKVASWFPAYILDGHSVPAGQLSWCCGDLGVSAALELATARGSEAGRRMLVLALVRSVLSRSTFEPVVDSCLCHGSCGHLHYALRMQRVLGEAARAAAVHWTRATLKARSQGVGVGGFEFLIHRGVRARHGLLRGAAGVGLSLLACVAPIEPSWDRCLLLSQMANNG